jgi:uncharacterized protein (TIGR03435 family)
MFGYYFIKRTAVIVILPAVMALGSSAPAQPDKTAPERPSFEVASIKPHKGVVTFSMDPSIHGRRVTATASTLLDLITTAYGIRYDQISGSPGWANSEHYDLEARADESAVVLTLAQCRKMLQTLLADRFQLKIHRETQDAPMYALTIGKNGPKMKPASADETKSGSFVRPGEQSIGLHMEVIKGTMAQLATQLSFTAGRPVVDRTSLQGYYAYTLDWFPANRAMPPDLDSPDMFQAVKEQLGLRLEPIMGLGEKLVIDYVEKPSEN